MAREFILNIINGLLKIYSLTQGQCKNNFFLLDSTNNTVNLYSKMGKFWGTSDFFLLYVFWSAEFESAVCGQNLVTQHRKNRKKKSFLYWFICYQ